MVGPGPQPTGHHPGEKPSGHSLERPGKGWPSLVEQGSGIRLQAYGGGAVALGAATNAIGGRPVGGSKTHRMSLPGFKDPISTPAPWLLCSTAGLGGLLDSATSGLRDLCFQVNEAKPPKREKTNCSSLIIASILAYYLDGSEVHSCRTHVHTHTAHTPHTRHTQMSRAMQHTIHTTHTTHKK